MFQFVDFLVTWIKEKLITLNHFNCFWYQSYFLYLFIYAENEHFLHLSLCQPSMESEATFIVEWATKGVYFDEEGGYYDSVMNS